jgi:hypothetical protein
LDDRTTEDRRLGDRVNGKRRVDYRKRAGEYIRGKNIEIVRRKGSD